MAKKSIKVSDLLGGYDLLKTFVSTNSAAITAKGLVPATIIAALDSQKADIAAKDGVQENLKSDLRDATLALDASVSTNYPLWSSTIDLLRGAFGNTSVKGKQLTNMRKGIIGTAGGTSGTSSTSTSGSGSGSSSGGGSSSSSSGGSSSSSSS